MRSILTAFARNRVFANIVLLMFFVGGGIASTKMIRETFPEFSLDMIYVSVIWPGADPEEVEEGIVRKIEEGIEGLEGIRQYNGTASENAGSVLIEVSEDYDVDYVKERVRNAVDAISTFPEEAEKPITEEITFREQVMMIALSGGQLSEKDLKEWAERVKEELRVLPEISQVQVLGGRDYEIGIEVSEERLREYGLTFAQVAQAVRTSSLNLSGGIMRTEGEEIRLRTLERKYTGEELSKIVLLARPEGDVVTLDRVATVRDGFTEDPILSRFNGNPTITVVVMKTPEEDALAIDDAVQQYIDQKQSQLPEGLSMEIWGRTSDILRSRIDLLVRNGISGLLVVFIMLWLFLDIRLSFWVGLGMPVSFLGAMIIMWAFGATLNMISLFGLIMVLGIVVDDATVVGEAIYVHRKNGSPPLKAAIDGALEVAMPVLGSVTTTIVAFVPLFFIGGIMGKFISILPLVVIACLTVSLVECFVGFPAHLSTLPDPNRPMESRNALIRFGARFHRFTNHGMEWFVEHMYEPFLARALAFRYVSMALAAGLILVMAGIIIAGFLKFEFFPDLDGDVMTATLEFPDGTPFAVTEDAIQRIEAALHRLESSTTTVSGKPLVENVFTIVGSTINDSQEPPKRGSNAGSVRAQLLAPEDRGIHADELMVAWEKEIGRIPGATALSFAGMGAGPPGAPIEIWLQGHDMETILAASAEIEDKLRSYDGVFQVQNDFRPGKNEIKLKLKPEARALGLTAADLARQVYAGYFGEEAIRLQRGRDDIRVRVRYPEEERKKIAEFERVRIRTPRGHEVPLMSVADISVGPGYATIKRTDGMRRVTVSADVDANRANAAEIMAELGASFFLDLRGKYPQVLMSFQGEQKKMRESLGGLKISYPLALLGMYIIIATLFRSYIQPMIIMFTVPMGMIGAIIGHFMFGYTLSFMSMMGMVALSGVVVNDAIVLIEAVNEYLAKGLPFFDAVRTGGARRFRAVFLTTVTTVGGLMPLILERDLQAKFLVPMAIAISMGVGFATILTLVLIPCMLAILNDIRRIAHWIIYRHWPTRESVEPATFRKIDLDEDAGGTHFESRPNAEAAEAAARQS